MLVRSAAMSKPAAPRTIAQRSVQKDAKVQEKLVPEPRRDRQLAQPTMIKVALGAPPYESRFEGLNNMTETLRNELDTDNNWTS
jgi:hypothetical protein